MTPISPFLLVFFLALSLNLKQKCIRRGLRALEVREFRMPSNTAVPVETRRELATEVVETMPPRKKNSNFFKKIIQNMFLTNFFFPEIQVITTLPAVAGRRKQPREQA